jgi:hypothetical protein
MWSAKKPRFEIADEYKTSILLSLNDLTSRTQFISFSNIVAQFLEAYKAKVVQSSSP